MPLVVDPAEEQALRFRARRELRSRMRQLRASLPESSRAARSALITEHVLAMDHWRDAHTVALFVSMDTEVQTPALIEAARAQGKRVALPVVLDGEGIVFRAPFDREPSWPMVTSSFGVQEPCDEAPRVNWESIDFVLVPALALAPSGHRLGYGRGYYDRTLERPELARAVRVAVGYDFQLLADLPTHAGDVPVHWIVTDQRVLRAESARDG